MDSHTNMEKLSERTRANASAWTRRKGKENRKDKGEGVLEMTAVFFFFLEILYL